MKSDKIAVIKRNIGTNENTKETTLKSIISGHNNIFLKMDIEGYNFNMGEWSWLNNLSIDELNKFRQIVIEFHFPNTGKHWEQLRKLSQTHYLIHFHANNNNNVIYRIDGKMIPSVFECTYVRRDLLNNPPLNKTPLPREGDHCNVKTNMDYSFNCPLWVHS